MPGARRPPGMAEGLGRFFPIPPNDMTMTNYTPNSGYSSEIATWLDDYREKGRKEATEHRPPTDSARMDQHEAALQAEADKWLANAQRVFHATLAETSRSAVDLRQKSFDMQMKAEQLVSDESLRLTVDADMAAERKALVDAAENRMRAEVDWRDFRLKNNISERAAYPDSRVFHLSIVAILALAETCINAFFYENAQGLFGGFTVALGVAFVNMVGALLLGFCFRYKNLVALDNKILGWSCLVLFSLLSIYCNALFSAFRAEYQLLADPTDILQMRRGFSLAVSEAQKVFLLEMHFADLASFVLFGFGIVLSGLAFFKGYTLDDKYPNHGRADRAVKAAQQAETGKQDILRQKIKDFLHARRAELQAVIHEPAQLINLAARRISELRAGQIALVTEAQGIQRDFAMVLQAYRNANIAVRAADPPEYFKDIPQLASGVSGSAADPVIMEFLQLQEELMHWRTTCQEPLNAKLQSLQGDAASILNHAISDFLKAIDAEAQERINRSAPAIHRDGVRSTDA